MEHLAELYLREGHAVLDLFGSRGWRRPSLAQKPIR